jgi:hypothetical protein
VPTLYVQHGYRLEPSSGTICQFLSQEDGTQFQKVGFSPPQPDIPAEGSAPAPLAKKGGQRTKLANFSSEEDMRVCHAWLGVSCDPIVNTGQKRQGFWN